MDRIRGTGVNPSTSFSFISPAAVLSCARRAGSLLPSRHLQKLRRAASATLRHAGARPHLALPHPQPIPGTYCAEDQVRLGNHLTRTSVRFRLPFMHAALHTCSLPPSPPPPPLSHTQTEHCHSLSRARARAHTHAHAHTHSLSY
jgi:hypothetical protein